MTDLPEIAYGTMCWNPTFTRRAVLEVHRQDYPPELKTHYLLYQAPFPVHFQHPFPHKIVHVNVPGVWPAAWAFKLKALLGRALARYVLLFDEDDMFDFDYTQRAVKPLLKGKYKIAWTHNQTFVQRSKIWTGEYNSPIGTICGDRELMLEALKELFKELPEGASRNKQGEMTGPADYRYRLILGRMYRSQITTHDGNRYYTRHSGMITRRRNFEEDIDFGWDATNKIATPRISRPGSAGPDWDITIK